MIVSFKFYVMNFVEIVIDFYLHITSNVSQVFANCSHYTTYSLLNFVHVIVCDFGLANRVWKFLEFMQNMFEAWEFKENCLRILFLGNWVQNKCFWKSFHLILMHFIHKILCFEEFLHKISLFFKKIGFSWILINQTCFSIDWNCY